MTPTMRVQIQPTPNATIDIPAEYIDAFLELLELRTEETVAHSRRVAALSEELADAAGFAPGWISEVVRPAAFLHHVLRAPGSAISARSRFPTDCLLRPTASDRPTGHSSRRIRFSPNRCSSVFPTFPLAGRKARPLLPIVRHVHEWWKREASSAVGWTVAATRTESPARRYHCRLA